MYYTPIQGPDMAKGSRVQLVRFPPELDAAVTADLARRNQHSRGAEWTTSDWVRAACQEKLNKGHRSRRPRKTTQAPPEPTR